jgi:type III secretion system FlhB-like substrate exporter
VAGTLRQLRMSREDLRQETRESEGDPHVKGRLRRLRESRARRRMLASVPKAAVVVTNPTHYAVALAYEQGQAAPPRIVAKGVDAMAARIREAAAEHGVPIVPSPPLARALWRLEVDTESRRSTGRRWRRSSLSCCACAGRGAVSPDSRAPDRKGFSASCFPNVLVSAGRNPHTLSLDIRSVTHRGRGDRTSLTCNPKLRSGATPLQAGYPEWKRERRSTPRSARSNGPSARARS